MKVIVVGINHAGTSFIRTLAAFNKDIEIVAYDRNDNISFLGCGIALWVSGVVKDPKGLFYADKKLLESKGAKVHMKHDVLSVNTDEKKIRVKNLETNEEFEDTYDKLVYAGGSWPLSFNWEGIDLGGIHICKIYQDAEKIIEEAKSDQIKEVTVVGVGYIGIELVEAFHELGKKVHMIDVIDQPVGNYYGREFTEPLLESIKKAGVNVHLNERVLAFKGENGRVEKVVTDKGEYDSQLVITACGFTPNGQKILPQAEKIRNGAIKVDVHSQALGLTDVYVLGDSAAIYNVAIKTHTHTALATNAVKTGVAAAAHIAGIKPVKLNSITGTNGLCVFGHKLASTGVTVSMAKRFGFDVESTYFSDADRAEFMNEYGKVALKLVYDKKTFRLMGAQVVSYGDDNHSEVMYYLSLAIQQELSLFDLLLSDVYFLPHYNKPFNFILSTILKALNVNL